MAYGYRVLVFALVFLLSQNFSLAVTNGSDRQTAPRAYLQSDSGFVKPEKLVIDGKAAEARDFLISTYDIEDFDHIKESDPEAWRSLYNHHRYGVAGNRGIVLGLLSGIAVAIFLQAKAHPAVAPSLVAAGLIYGWNCRHMAKHNLHRAINRLNGVNEFTKSHDPNAPVIGFAVNY